MRFFVIKQDTDLKALSRKLLSTDRDNAPAAMERLKALNPHVDIARIAPGTVLLVPDTPDFKREDTDSVGASFDDFSHDAAASLRTMSGRVRDGLAQQAERDKEVGKVLKSANIRKLAADDSELRNRIEEAGDRIASDAKQAKQVASRLAAMEEGLAAELKKLQQLAG